MTAPATIWRSTAVRRGRSARGLANRPELAQDPIMERLEALIRAGVLPANHQLGHDELDAIASLSEQELEQLMRSRPGQPVEAGAPTFAISI